MKRLLRTAATLALLFLAPACTGDGRGVPGESRISGRAGVAISSQRIAPPISRRPGEPMPAP